MRQPLPPRRHAETFNLRFWGQDWQVTVGYYADHVSVGEIFVSGGKSGTEAVALARDAAIILSFALQHGASLSDIRHAITRNQDGSPSTIVGAILDEMLKEKKQ